MNIIASLAIFGLLVVVVAFDIAAIFTDLRAFRAQPSALPVLDFPAQQSTAPRRVNRWVHLAAFLLLMCVSTSFAYNNLFGFYADSAKLRDVLRQNVENESQKEFYIARNRVEEAIYGEANKLLKRYNQNTDKALKIMDRAYNGILLENQDIKFSELDLSAYTSIKSAASKARDTYKYIPLKVNDTFVFDRGVDGWEEFYNYILTLLRSSDLGELSVTRRRYNFYWAGVDTTDLVMRTPMDYYTLEYTVQKNGADLFEINPHNYIVREAGRGVGNELNPGSEYFRMDTPTDVNNASRTVSMDQFQLILELSDQFDSRAQLCYLWYEPMPDPVNRAGDDYNLVTFDEGLQFNKEEFQGLIRENHVIFGKYLELLDLIDDADVHTKLNKGMSSINSVINYILQNSYDETFESLPTESGATDDATDDATDFNQTILNALETSSLTAVYFNYAVASESQVVLSYDVLLNGELGINPAKRLNIQDQDSGTGSDNRGMLNDIYSSRIFAGILLLTAALIDLMAFFVGLSLFKSVYVFRRAQNRRIVDLGYINYDLMLRNVFHSKQSIQELRSLLQQISEINTVTLEQQVRFNGLGIDLCDAESRANLESWANDYLAEKSDE